MMRRGCCLWKRREYKEERLELKGIIIKYTVAKILFEKKKKKGGGGLEATPYPYETRIFKIVLEKILMSIDNLFFILFFEKSNFCNLAIGPVI